MHFRLLSQRRIRIWGGGEHGKPLNTPLPTIKVNIPAYIGITKNTWLLVTLFFPVTSLCNHRRRLWGSPGGRPQYLRNAHAFMSYYHLLTPQYFVFPTQYFDKSTPCL